MPTPAFPEFEQSQRQAAFFMEALLSRLRGILAHRGWVMNVSFARADYAIPGWVVRLSTPAHKIIGVGGGAGGDGSGGVGSLSAETHDFGIAIWLGINERRMIYIQQARVPAEECSKIFKFSFGAAEKIGWAFNFEPLPVALASGPNYPENGGDANGPDADDGVGNLDAPQSSGRIHGYHQEETRGIAWTSIWGTVESDHIMVTPHWSENSDGPVKLTPAGLFWANDIALMIQSAFRTAQRYGLDSSGTNPFPL